MTQVRPTKTRKGSRRQPIDWGQLLTIRGYRFEQSIWIVNQRKRWLLLGFLTLYAVLGLRLSWWVFAPTNDSVIKTSLNAGVVVTPATPRAAQSPPPNLNVPTHEDRVAARTRAQIVDHRGVILATTVKSVDLAVRVNRLDRPFDEVLDQLTQTIPNVPRARVLRRLRLGDRYIVVRRALTPDEAKAVQGLGLAGLEMTNRPLRVYPHGRVMAHVVGFLNGDGVGQTGLERAFEQRLRPLSNATSASPTPPTARTVRTMVDVRHQYVVWNTLTAAMERMQLKGAVGVLVDLADNEIRAMVSLPDYNPNLAQLGQQRPTLNRATYAVYEQGSTFKIFNTAMALEHLVTALRRTFPTTQRLNVDRFTIKDAYPKDHDLTLAEIFIYSSNVGSARMALAMGAAEQRRFLQRLGLTGLMATDLPAETLPPMLPRWSDADSSVATRSYGYGVSISPLQMASAVASLVRDGRRTSLQLTPSMHASLTVSPGQGEQVISNDTVQKLRALLYLNTKLGTATRAELDRYYVGGKTGTSLKLDAQGQYDPKRVLASFVAAFPVFEPRFLLYVLLDEPKGLTRQGRNAGRVTAPLVREMVSQLVLIEAMPAYEPANPKVQKLLRTASRLERTIKTYR